MIEEMAVVRRIAFQSESYKEACRLRDRLLRQPLGLSLFDEDLMEEKEQWHFGLFDEAQGLMACGVAHQFEPQGAKCAKIRQFAVSEEWQGQGRGRLLMQEMEDFLRTTGFEKVVLHARAHVRGFYGNLGYVEEGEEFQEVGLTHVRMLKEI